MLGGFIPATNNVFVVMTFGSSSGAFSDLAGQDLGFYRYFRKLVDATSATLETRRAPIAVDDPITINEDIISDLVVLANDNDAYGLTIRLAGVTAPLTAPPPPTSTARSTTCRTRTTSAPTPSPTSSTTATAAAAPAASTSRSKA